MADDTDDSLDYMAPSPECKVSVFEEVMVQQVKEFVLNMPYMINPSMLLCP